MIYDDICGLDVKFYTFPCIDSTQLMAREYINSEAWGSQQPTVFLTQQQTNGIGKGHNQWISDKGSLYCSIIWPIASNFRNAVVDVSPHLFVAYDIAGVICRYLQEEYFIFDIALKWPNDIYIQDRKLGGVLVDIFEHQQAMIIGIGLNINSNHDICTPYYISTSLSQNMGRKYDVYNKVAPPILHQIFIYLVDRENGLYRIRTYDPCHVKAMLYH